MASRVESRSGTDPTEAVADRATIKGVNLQPIERQVVTARDRRQKTERRIKPLPFSQIVKRSD